MSRTSAREHAFKILFQLQFVREETEESVKQYLDSFTTEEVDENDLAFILKEVEGVRTHEEELDQKISAALKGWTLYRLSRVDRCILRLAVFEIQKDPDIPTGVAINEAVVLSKRYSGEESSRFVNGVLAKLA